MANSSARSGKGMENRLRNEPSGDFDYLIKLLALGDSGVGKTSLWMRYANDTFSTSTGTTVGIDLFEKRVTVGGERMHLQLWDTSGQERYHAVSTSFFRNVYGFLLVFDVTSDISFMNVRTWFQQIKEQCQAENPDIILVGNKIDLKEMAGCGVVNTGKIKELAAELRLDYIETSAKTGKNVDAAFEKLVNLIAVSMERKLQQGLTSTFPEDKSSSCSC